MMELMLAIFLEKHTKKTSQNSSKPSSQTQKDETALDKPGAKGKGKTETSQSADNTRTVETVVTLPVTVCEHCGQSLDTTACDCIERRTRIDIVFEKTVEHFDAQVKTCPACRQTSKATHPSDLKGPLQYGQGLKAYVIHLLIAQMIPLHRAQKMIKPLIGQTLSQACLLKYLRQLHEALAPWEQAMVEQLLTQPVLHSDETSLRVDKRNHWIHVYASQDITLKFLHRHRGKKAMEDIHIIPRYGGVVIHDCWASYLSYPDCSHALCGSHLLRELTFVVDSNGYAWAKNMKRLLQETCKAVTQSPNKMLSDSACRNLQKRYRNILTRGGKELPPIPDKPNGRRGKIAKSDAHNLWERLRKHENAVLLFAKNKHVAFTNNRAERDLRMAKVKQKVSGCFRNEIYAQAYCRISSYLQSMANKGFNPLIAIQMALAGNINLGGGE
jgi:transposase